jgi:hypothetical protein
MQDDEAPFGSGVLWSAVYVSNLLVPLFLGLGVTAKGGRVGMSVVVIVVWLLGLWAVRYTVLRRSLFIGGAVTAATQLFPMLQVAAGMFALGGWSRLSGGVDDPHNAQLSELGGCVVTACVAVQLLLAALVIGFCTLTVASRLR